VDDHALPSIGMHKTITSKLGVKEWNLTIAQNNREIAHVTQDDKSTGEIDAVIPLGPLSIDTVPAPLIAELTVVDYAGSSKSVSDKLEIRMLASGSEIAREVRTFYFFEPWTECPTLIASNKALIEKIAVSTQDGARITVSADVLTDGKQWGSGLIAEEVLATLNTHAIHPLQFNLEHVPPKPTSDIASPDDALFSHSVRVTVEQSMVGKNSGKP